MDKRPFDTRFGQSFNSTVYGLYLLIVGGADILATKGKTGEIIHPAVIPYAFAAIALVAFIAWVINYLQLRAIATTSLSRIDSAAQGYIELQGQVEQLGTTPLVSRLTETPCVWYRYSIEVIGGKKPLPVAFGLQKDLSDFGTSDAPFLINDGSGHCTIEAKGAEINTSVKKSWLNGGYSYTEWLLLPGNNIYACGELATIGGGNSEFDVDSEVSQWLTDLKNDHQQLLDRFDLNKDGEIDATEWELARREAWREVEAKHRVAIPSGETKVLRKPTDGRPFLITTDPPARLKSKYQRWTWVHIGVFFASSILAFASGMFL